MTTQDIDPTAPNYDPASSFFPGYLPDAVVGGNVIEFKTGYRGNGKLQADHYERMIHAKEI